MYIEGSCKACFNRFFKEIKSIAKKEKLICNCFFENQSIDYLCRSVELELVSMYEMIENYQVKMVPKHKPRKNKKQKVNPICPFEPNTGHYKHPSVLKSGPRKHKCAKGLQLRDCPVLPKVSQWMFPDTADFKGDIRTCDETMMNSKMETYAQLVLSLFLPHRCADDLKANVEKFRYTHKLQEVHQRETAYLEQGDTEKVHVFTIAENTIFAKQVQCSESVSYLS